MHLRLVASSPDRNVRREYALDVAVDLFGLWQIETCYGRCGSRGHRRVQVVPSEREARRIVRQVLQRRRSAPKRIGVRYQLVELTGGDDWIDPEAFAR